MRKRVLLLVLFSVLVLNGCRQAGGSTPTPAGTKPQATAQQTNQESNPSPVPPSDIPPSGQEAYPYPAPPTYIAATPRTYPPPEGGQPTATQFTIPTPGSDTAVVTGKLVNVDDGKPLALVSVYLGKKLYLTPAPGYTYGLQERTSPHTISTEEGEFAIKDVPPGEYILMIFTPFGASVVMQPNTDRELDVIVTAGQLMDVGTMEAVMPELR